MPKLNVQQNNQNVIQAFKNALAIGNLKGIIASDGSHNFSTAGSNRNLLDNPWFGSGEVVNQRGNTSGTVSNAYFIDRWKLSGTYSIAASGITFTCNAGAGVSQIFNHALTIGETYTFSVKYADLSIVSVTFAPLANRENAYPFGDGLYLEIDTRAAFPTHRCIVYTPGTSWTREIMAVKLELGSVSTLVNDAPPDYWQELDKCLYYFERITNNGSSPITIGAGFADGVNNLYVPVHIHRKRAGIATISTSGVIYAGQRSSNISVSSVTQYNSSPDGIITLLAVTPSSFTSNEYYRLALGAGAHIDFSADL